ncbi:Coenzyme PQQ synthesis protein D (PqqD) [Blastococcus aurantiacus]|uniref:Coenzyme PQQ synthesis protein D (PqqD) n=1 Tax=Blastococcus aurantiacus TaxID=1550231 RepID=A0A1G7MTQ0_9ACTN|nr:PqqD family protein [Blastococcus aurantiacus]SDF65124.1 Coenzyme PQQ synthesis protein D (PqqD) [Blastococcus aurantiacus]
MSEGTGKSIRLRQGAVTWHEADGEVIALDLQSSDYLGVNPAGAALWTRLVDGATEAELIETLRSRYELDHERAAADVKSFLGEARTRGLLEE